MQRYMKPGDACLLGIMGFRIVPSCMAAAWWMRSICHDLCHTGARAPADSPDSKTTKPKVASAKTRVQQGRQTPAAKEGAPATEDDASPKK